MKSQKYLTLLFIILILIMVVGIILTVLFANRSLIAGIGINISTEMFGILVTVLFVQSLFNKVNKQNNLQIAKGGFYKASTAIVLLLDHFTCLLKGAISKKPNIPITSINDFFSQERLSEFDHLDLGAPFRPTIPQGYTWAELLRDKVRSFKGSIKNIQDIYGVFLPAEYFKLLDDLIDDPYLLYLEGVGMFMQECREDYPTRLPYVADDGKQERIVFFTKFCKIIDLNNEYSDTNIRLSDETTF